MSHRSEHGFTIIEIMLAIVVLSVGVMALVGSSALATRMIGRGGVSTQVTQVALARADLIRVYAASTSPGCTNANVANGSATDTTSMGTVSESWQLTGAAGDPTRDVRMMFTYRVPRGTRTDTMMITLYCK
jgi:prepilin-type N-terminal cleavage/methylation domain-containing protein